MRSITHPYRTATATDRRMSAALIEELICYVAMCVVGAIPVGSALARGGAFGVEPTIGLLMMLAGAAGLVFGRTTGRDER